MTLSSGTKLGRYEIRSQLGEGGMGDVKISLLRDVPYIPLDHRFVAK